MFELRALAFGLLAMTTAAVETTAAVPALVRVVVLDTSSSMAGERIDTAKNELLDLARKLPPTPDCPFVIIPFSGEVGEVKTCTDLKTFEDFVVRLQANGGTAIAQGLDRALTELQRYAGCRHACVFLYTDGEDGDAAGITRQEERLDQLFAARQQQGLNQSVVFCKRWEQANAALLKQIAQRGHAKVLDGKEMALRPVTLTPGLQLVRAGWAADQPLLLDIELVASLAATGLPKGMSIPGLKFTCQTAGASGNIQADVAVDGKQTIRVRVPAPKSAGKMIDVVFAVGGAQEIATKTELLLPLVPSDQVRVAVPLPSRDGPFTLTAQAVGDGKPTWIDPLNGIARVPLRLDVSVLPPSGQIWLGPIELAVELPSGVKMASGTDRIVINERKPVSAALTLEGPLTAISADRGALNLSLSTTLAPPGVVVLPAALAVRAEVPWPAPSPVTIETRVTAVGAARWANLAQAVGTFIVDLQVRVDGPLPDASEVLVRSPPGVRLLRFDPAQIHTGTQTVRVTVEANLPAGQPKTFILDVLPPAAPNTLSISAPRPIQFEVVGPAAVQLALSHNGMTPRVFVLNGRRREIPQSLFAMPLITSQVDPGSSRDLAVKLNPGDGLDWSGAARPFKVNEGLELRVLLPENREVSFFQDTVVEAELCVEPATPTPAVLGSKQMVRVHIEAPFKRFLFYGVSGLSALLVLYCLARMIRRFTTPIRPLCAASRSVVVRQRST